MIQIIMTRRSCILTHHLEKYNVFTKSPHPPKETDPKHDSPNN